MQKSRKTKINLVIVNMLAHEQFSLKFSQKGYIVGMLILHVNILFQKSILLDSLLT